MKKFLGNTINKRLLHKDNVKKILKIYGKINLE
jgi:hypothetical protein